MLGFPVKPSTTDTHTCTLPQSTSQHILYRHNYVVLRLWERKSSIAQNTVCWSARQPCLHCTGALVALLACLIASFVCAKQPRSGTIIQFLLGHLIGK